MSGGDWLYRQGELVLGPASAQQLVEKLNTGELTGQTEVAPIGESRFRRLAEVDFFKVPLAKAEAKLRVEAVARAQQSKARRKRNAIVAVVTAIAIVVAAGAAVLARYFAVHNPFRSAEEELISVEAPRITLARAHKGDEEFLDYSGVKRPEPGRATGTSARPGTKPTGTVTDEDGLEMAQIDQAAINSVVNAHKSKLNVCFIEEIRRNPQVAAKIPLEFVVGNNGKVSKLWVDNPTYKTGALADCLFRELQKWPFKAFDGEQPSVSLSFTIGHPKT